jgi:uncharacterized protein
MSRQKLLIPLALLTLLLLPPGGASAAERTVAVGARATIEVPNDTAGVGLSVSRERRSRAAALQAASARLQAVIAAVQKIPGVGPGDVETGRISVGKRLRGERPVYRATEGIAVTLHEPGRAGELVAAALAAGASGVGGPRFFVGDAEAAYGKALAAAFDKAKAKAAALATQAGGTLGPAVTIEEGGDPPSFDAPSAAEGKGTSGSAAPPTKPGKSTVTAFVRVVFSLL